MYSGKLTFSTHPHTEKIIISVGGRRKYQANAYFKKKFTANEWVEKKNSYLQQFTKPSPPLLPLGPSEVKWLVPKCVWSSFMNRTLVVRFLQGPPPVSSHLILSFLFVFSWEVHLM